MRETAVQLAVGGPPPLIITPEILAAVQAMPPRRPFCLITNIEASSFPNVNGTSQKRIITSLTADELRYTNPTATTGTVAEVVWRRAK